MFVMFFAEEVNSFFLVLEDLFVYFSYVFLLLRFLVFDDAVVFVQKDVVDHVVGFVDEFTVLTQHFMFYNDALSFLLLVGEALH
jgi:hypothetical protein